MIQTDLDTESRDTVAVLETQAVTPSLEEERADLAERYAQRIEEMRGDVRAQVTVLTQMLEEYEGLMRNRLREEMASTLERYQAMKFLKPLLKDVGKTGSFMQAFKTFASIIGNFSTLMNRRGSDLKLNEKGKIDTQRLDVAVIYTDLRGFSTLPEIFGDKTFEFMQKNYFDPVLKLCLKYGVKVLNTGGDSIVFYCTDEVDEHGKVVKYKQEIAAEFSFALNDLTNDLADIYAAHGVGSSEKLYNTGIGLSEGNLILGDGGDGSDYTEPGTIGGIQEQQKKLFKEKYGLEDHDSDLILMMSVCQVINTAARLEQLDPRFPNHNILIDEQTYHSLPDQMQKHFVDLGFMELRGSGLKRVFGTLRRPKSSISSFSRTTALSMSAEDIRTGAGTQEIPSIPSTVSQSGLWKASFTTQAVPPDAILEVPPDESNGSVHPKPVPEY